VLAQRIIEARPFYSLNDLLKVKGIGQVTLEKIIAQGCAYVEEFYFIGGAPPPPTPSPPSYPKILISEIQIASENSEKDDFVELFNPNSEEIDLTNWYLQRKTKGAQDFSSYAPKSLFSEKKILAKNYFLVANASSTFSADATTTYPLTEDNTLYLKNPNGEVVDKVGWGNAQDYETATTSNPEVGKSIGRKWSTTTENYIDTDNNQSDFEIQNPTPKERNNSLPTASFTFSPPAPLLNEQILFDASSSTDPDGTISAYIWDFAGNATTTNWATTTYNFSTSGNFIITLRVVDDLGATSSPATATITIAYPALSVVINEIAWMGTEASASDEWIELYNNTDQDLDLTGWQLTFLPRDATTTRIISTFATSTGTTTLSAHGYFLLERTNDEPVKDIKADQIFKGALNDDGGIFELRDASSTLIDLIDCSSSWFAGTTTLRYVSMERISSTSTATSNNWANNNLITRNGKDAAGNKINGTPKAQNSVSKSETTIDIQNFNFLFDPSGDNFSQVTLTYLGNPYIIGSLTIPENKTLKIEPGVVLKFKELPYYGGGDSLVIKGTLLAEGNSGKEIVFTSLLTPVGDKNWWSRIYFASSSQNSILDHCQLRYGGKKQTEAYSTFVDSTSIIFRNCLLENPNSSGLKLVNSSSTIENVTIQNASSGEAIVIFGGNPVIRNSTFRNTWSGMFIKEGSRALVEGNTFSEINYYLGPIVISDSYPTFQNNSATNNFLNGIYLSGTINQNWTLTKDLPYLISNLKISTTTILIIDPGTLVKFATSTPGKLEVYGTLKAQGLDLQENSIIFTSLQENHYWAQIYFAPSGQDSILENAIVSYGGKTSYGAIRIKESKVELKNNIFKNNGPGYYTLYIENASSSIISNSSFENCQIAIKIIGSCPQIQNLSFNNCSYTYSRDFDTPTLNSTSIDPLTVCSP